MVLKYFGKLIARAAEGSVLLTDRLTILIVPFTTLIVWAFGAKMTTSLQEILLIGIAITVVTVVIFRLVAASYFLWRDDQKSKARLQASLEAPERDAETAMKRFSIEARKDLSDRLAWLVSVTVMGKTASSFIPNLDSRLVEETLKIDVRINQLSYDVPLRIAAIRLRDYCFEVLTGSEINHERLWKQRKLTFCILHKEDHISDVMSLMELEVLTEDYGDKKYAVPDREDDDVFEQLKSLIRKLGDRYHSPEIRNSLKKAASEIEPK